MTISRIGMIGVVVAALVLLAGCSAGGSSAPETATTTPADTPAPDGELVTIDAHEWAVLETYDSGAVDDDYGVTGAAQNHDDQRLDVFIEVRYYDAEGVQIDDTTTHASGVEPGGEFRFEAHYLGDDADDVAEYEIGWEAYPS